MKNLARFSLCMMLLMAVGCQSPMKMWKPDFKFWESEPDVTESQFESPERMVVVWSPAMYNEPGKKPTRGFGGRIYFYGKQNNPIAVEGQLVVNAYDDSQMKQKASQAPDRRYAFPQETFSGHFAPTDLGPSYSVWVPWDEVGGQQMQISLLPVFTASSGKVVMAQPSPNVLPGTQSQVDPALQEPQLTTMPRVYEESAVKQISYEEPVAPAEALQPGMTQVTSSLPMSRQSMHEQLLGKPTSAATTTQNNAVVSSTPPTSMRATSIHIPSTLAARMSVAPTAAPTEKNTATVAPAAMPSSTGVVAPAAVPAADLRSPLSSSTMGRRSVLGQGVPRPWAPPDPRSTRYSRPQSQVPSAPVLQPTDGLLPMQPLPAG